MRRHKRKKIDYSDTRNDEDDESNMVDDDTVTATAQVNAQVDDCADPEQLLALMKARKGASKLTGVKANIKKLVIRMWPADVLQDYHDEDGAWNLNECFEPGGQKPILDQLFHILDQIADDFDEKTGKLVLKEGVILPFLTILLSLCGTDNGPNGTTIQLSGLYDADDKVWKSATGRVVQAFSDWWPAMKKGINYGNGQECVVVLARTTCHRIFNKKGKVDPSHKHCNEYKNAETTQVFCILKPFIDALPEDCKVYLISGGGKGCIPFLTSKHSLINENVNVVQYALGASHFSGYSSVNNYTDEGIKNDFVKYTARAAELSSIAGLIEGDIINYCDALGVVSELLLSEGTLLQARKVNKATCMVVEDPNGKKEFAIAKERHLEQCTSGGQKGGESKSAPKVAAARVNGNVGNQIKMMKEGKHGVGGTPDEPTDETKQLYYVECLGLSGTSGCLAEPPTSSFAQANRVGANGRAQFSASCSSCHTGKHRNWKQIGNKLPVQERVVWTRVGPVETDEVCGFGLPGFHTGGRYSESYEKYGCGAKACVNYTSNYVPEWAYFCKECEGKLGKAKE